ncbi:protein PIN-LIKES 3 isoform X3 [Neltuma alba]|uniref:protein PIN-LIKES 3 isoform X3 n=1 Tax=Neltuma alba TaxID=207710 RepID=UPI0010A444CA|nr:protein PIN-LIKES 3-like isoform X3 [Prosopis alba]
MRIIKQLWEKDTMHFWSLFFTALMPVLKVLLITVVGIILALDRFSILKKDARKHVNSMVFFVFIPALALSNLAKAMTIKSLVMLWFMPLNVLLTFIIGSALGWLLIKITRVPHHLRGLILGCCAAGNMGNMSLIIIPAICNEASSPFGDKDVCNRNGLAYASLTLALGNIFMWTYVYNLVRIYSCKSSDANSLVKPLSTPETDPENSSACSTEPLVTSQNTSQTNDCAIGPETGSAMLESLQVTKQEKIMKEFKALVEKMNLKALLAPATIGSIIGLIIGAVPLFHNALVGDNAPLRAVENSLSMLGDAAIPTMTLLAGASLLDGLEGSGMQFSIIFGILVVRYIALPLCGVVILKGAMHVGMIHPDPLYLFLLLLQYSFPPAMSISTVTQMFGAGVSECSLVMLVTYACAAVSLTLWSTFFMWLVL